MRVDCICFLEISEEFARESKTSSTSSVFESLKFYYTCSDVMWEKDVSNQ